MENFKTRLMLATALFIQTSASQADEIPLNRIKLPKGFSISVFAPVPGARSLTRGDKGTIFVGTRDDKVFAVVDKDADGKAEEVFTIAKGLNEPNGVAFRNGALYIAEISRLSRMERIEEQLTKPPQPEKLAVEFPSDKHHGWKFIAFGPDDKLYVPVGAPCNVCDKGDQYSAIFQVDPEGKDKQLFAKGIRNTVGFAWHPETKQMYFTENGRDLLGDEVPQDELNVAAKPGLDFGFPRCHEGKTADPEFGRMPDPCAQSEKPLVLLGPHVAALGMRFYAGKQFPSIYRGRVFIAQHGSWNRSKPIGYQVVTVSLDNKKVEPFATGWLGTDGKAWGRPVDVLELPDGSLLVSDDEADVIYRIAYKS